MKQYINYIPETLNEEYAVLVGRLEAFAAYVNNEKYNVSRELCAKMLGFELDVFELNVEEVKTEESSSNLFMKKNQTNICPF